MDIRRFGAHYRSPGYTLKRAKEVYETYYDIRYPGHERRAGPPAARLERLRVARRARRRVRREVGLGAGQLVRVERGRGRRGAAAARAGPGMHWSPAIGAEHRGRARDGRPCSTSPRSPSSRSAGPGAGDAARVAVRQPRRARGRRDHLHADAQPPRRDRVRLHGHPRRPRSASGSSPAPRSATTTSAGSRATLPTDGSVRSPTSPRAGRASGSGARARETILGPLTPDPLDFPYMTMREIAVGDVPVRALRVTFVGELGWELYCPTEYGAGAVAHAVGGRPAARAARRRLPCDRLAAAREGLPRVGGRHHADETPFEAGLGFCVARDKDVPRPRGAAVDGAAARRAAALPRPRRPALGGARQRAGARRRGRASAA